MDCLRDLCLIFRATTIIVVLCCARFFSKVQSSILECCFLFFGNKRCSSADVVKMQWERHNGEEKPVGQAVVGRGAFLRTAAAAAVAMVGTGAVVAAPRKAAAEVGGNFIL